MASPGEICGECMKVAMKSSRVEVPAEPVVVPVMAIAMLFSILAIVGICAGLLDGTPDKVPGIFWVAGIGGPAVIVLMVLNESQRQAEERARARRGWLAEKASVLSTLGGESVSGLGTEHAGRFFVYVHFSRDRDEVVYVGKGTGERDQDEGRTTAEHVAMLKARQIVIYRTLHDVKESVALEYESYLIGMLGRREDLGPLFNVRGGARRAKDWRTVIAEVTMGSAAGGSDTAG